MTENKRFTFGYNGITWHNKSDKGDYSTRDLLEICTWLNKQYEENEQLKFDNFNLNKTVECLDKTVKEQCNKLDWADECGVRWKEEYNKWIGGKNDRE